MLTWMVIGMFVMAALFIFSSLQDKKERLDLSRTRYKPGTREYEVQEYYRINKIGYNPETLEPSRLYDEYGFWHGTDY